MKTLPVTIPPTGLPPDECSAQALRHPLPSSELLALAADPAAFVVEMLRSRKVHKLALRGATESA